MPQLVLPLSPEFKDLEDNGVMIVPNMLSAEECTLGIRGVWDWLESLGRGIRRDDVKSYDNSKIWPMNTHGIIVSALFLVFSRQLNPIV